MPHSFVTPFKEKHLLVKLKRKSTRGTRVKLKSLGVLLQQVVPVFHMPRSTGSRVRKNKNTHRDTLAGLFKKTFVKTISWLSSLKTQPHDHDITQKQAAQTRHWSNPTMIFRFFLKSMCYIIFLWFEFKTCIQGVDKIIQRFHGKRNWCNLIIIALLQGKDVAWQLVTTNEVFF